MYRCCLTIFPRKSDQNLWSLEDERCTLWKGRGLGRHLTDKGFILSVESEAREKEIKANEKDQRIEAHKLKRAARDACNDKWKLIKIRHDNTALTWKLECERLKSAGTQPKDLPAKLKRPPKPKPVVEDDLDNNEEEESGEMSR